MEADPPKIEPGRGRLYYDKRRKTIVSEFPACMMPDGAEPCGAFSKLEAERDAWKDQAVKQAYVIGWIEAWVCNPVGSYSVSALDGLFAMTRDKINTLRPLGEQ